MGAGNPARAHRAAWLGAGFVAAVTGTIGVTSAIAPALWMNLFTQDTAVRAFGASYLQIVGVFYGLYGFGLALFFASQGAGRMFWPLAGSVARLAIVALGGWLCLHVWQTPASAFFGAVALSLAGFGLTIAGAIKLGSWKRSRRRTRTIAVRPAAFEATIRSKSLEWAQVIRQANIKIDP